MTDCELEVLEVALKKGPVVWRTDQGIFEVRHSYAYPNALRIHKAIGGDRIPEHTAEFHEFHSMRQLFMPRAGQAINATEDRIDADHK